MDAFHEELEKIAVSWRRLRILRSRKGRRPVRVDTLLRKEKEGTLYKHTGNDHKIATVIGYVANSVTGIEAQPKKKKGDLPSREDNDAVKREDGRGNATTVYGPGTSMLIPHAGGLERSE